MKSAATKVWLWLQENPWAIMVAVLGVFAAYLLLKSKNNKISNLKDAVAVQATLGSIKANEAKAEVLRAVADAKDEEVAQIDYAIAASKRRVVEIHQGKVDQNASDAEIAALFTNSGL